MNQSISGQSFLSSTTTSADSSSIFCTNSTNRMIAYENRHRRQLPSIGVYTLNNNDKRRKSPSSYEFDDSNSSLASFTMTTKSTTIDDDRCRSNNQSIGGRLLKSTDMAAL